MVRRVMSGTRVWVVGGHSSRRDYCFYGTGGWDADKSGALTRQAVGDARAYAGTANAVTSTEDGASRNSSIVTRRRMTLTGRATRSSLQ